jgi:hypothetical protein
VLVGVGVAEKSQVFDCRWAERMPFEADQPLNMAEDTLNCAFCDASAQET